MTVKWWVRQHTVAIVTTIMPTNETTNCYTRFRFIIQAYKKKSKYLKKYSQKTNAELAPPKMVYFSRKWMVWDYMRITYAKNRRKTRFLTIYNLFVFFYYL